MEAAERYQRACELVGRVLELPVKEREALLEKECDGDTALLREAESLLAYSAAPPLADDDPIPDEPQGIVAASSTGPHAELLLDQVYRLIRPLGEGGQGSVWLAEHTLLRKNFAIKFVRSMPAEQFLQEAQLLARFDHPNILDVAHFGFDAALDNLPYLVMEFVEGESLLDCCLRHGQLRADNDEHWQIVSMLLGAVSHAHAIGVVHGDLSPSNVMLEADPHTTPQHRILKILDFGLARLNYPSAGPNAGGTAAILAPELLKGAAPSPASDVFACGVLLYWALTGVFPFGTSFWDVQSRQATGTLVPPSQAAEGVPNELDQPLLAMLALNPVERTASVDHALSQLGGARQRFNARLAAAALFSKQRDWRTQETPRRIVIGIVAPFLVLLLVQLFCVTDIARLLEGRLADARFATSRQKDPDPHLSLVVVDDASLATDRRPLAQWGPDFGNNIGRILESGARAVALDLLLPEAWSEIPTFQRLVQKHSDRLVLGLLSSESGDIVGNEAVGRLTALLLGPKRYEHLFGFVNLEEDRDGTVRRAQAAYLDVNGRWRLSFPARALAAASLTNWTTVDPPFWIDYAVNMAQLPVVSWKDIDTAIGRRVFDNRLVIVGAAYAGSGDVLRAPALSGSTTLPGVTVQTLIANTLLSGTLVHTAATPVWLVPTASACVSIVVGALLFPHLYRRVLVGAVGICLIYAIIAWAAFLSARVMVPLVPAELGIAGSALASWGLQSRLSPYPTCINPPQSSPR
ncbi:MAG: CHASE2 domain-containing protein [Fimbriimonadaceae bacterium]|nr:CHASE2 domain-containing protein [Fimbriimonadaceae bacterium]